MLRILIVVAAAAALSNGAFLSAGTKGNQFIVRYSILPDPLHISSFYAMPRTIAAAQKDKFTKVADHGITLLASNALSLWCRNGDYRVCVFFDKQGSVAGIQLSVKVSEIEAAKVPLNFLTIPEWRRHTLLSNIVYSAATFFQSTKELAAGGRAMTEDTLTAPNGIYLLQTNSNGVQTGLLHVANPQDQAQSAGFYEQACFFGMGKHYFQNLYKGGTCKAHRPYFLLFGPKTKQMQGFGFFQYGKASQGRGWYETPPALVAKQIAPNSPDCMTKWINKYGLFTMHVFFVEKPYYTRC